MSKPIAFGSDRTSTELSREVAADRREWIEQQKQQVRGEATARPWRVVPIGSHRYIESDDGFVCDMQRDQCADEAAIAKSDADAALIVTCVNSFPTLVEALQIARNVVFVAGGKQNTWEPELKVIDAALTLAGEKGGERE